MTDKVATSFSEELASVAANLVEEAHLQIVDVVVGKAVDTTDGELIGVPASALPERPRTLWVKSKGWKGKPDRSISLAWQPSPSRTYLPL